MSTCFHTMSFPASVFPFFLAFANLIFQKWYLRVTLVCISLITGNMLLIFLWSIYISSVNCFFFSCFFVLCSLSCWRVCLFYCLELFNEVINLWSYMLQVLSQSFFCLLTLGWFLAYISLLVCLNIIISITLFLYGFYIWSYSQEVASWSLRVCVFLSYAFFFLSPSVILKISTLIHLDIISTFIKPGWLNTSQSWN